MVYKKLFWLCCLCALTACSTPPATRPIASSTPTQSVVERPRSTSEQVLDTAYSLLGTPYKRGGTTPLGMDCSGLVHTVFLQASIDLPRSSDAMANIGKKITRNKALPGDLIFFRTSGRGISHVGIINQVNGNELRFIHSSTSQGVIISSSENSYWKRRIVQISRVINP